MIVIQMGELQGTYGEARKNALWQDIPHARTYHAPCVDGCRRSPSPKSKSPDFCNTCRIIFAMPKILIKVFLGPLPLSLKRCGSSRLDLSPLPCTSTSSGTSFWSVGVGRLSFFFLVC